MSETDELGETSSSNLGQGINVIHAGSSSRSQKAVEIKSAVHVEEDEEKGDIQLEESDGGEGVDEYETTDFISMPTYSLESTFEQDPLELEYSYGYNCVTPNLCVVDPDTLLWYTGNIIHIFNTKQKRLSFRRSALGQDISFIAKSKTTDEFAIAENGGDKVSPMIIVYRWPDFKVCSVLRGGSTTYYKSVDFSSDGSKLVSQAGPPGDTVTIWDIRQKTAVMSFQNPDETVSKAVFSSFDPDVFITCGAGHIKFWRLIETFTGLKIESLPGRFGEAENNDVSALCFLPEGRVVSNFCGGNLAIWKPDASLELSFSMKNFEPCHSDLITFIQIYLEDNHVYTSGLDGKVRVWNYSYITGFYNDEQQDSMHVDIEPSYERTIEDKKGNFGTPILMLSKDEKEFPYHFYVQDMKGGVWLLDLELKKNPDPWTRLYSCHAGPIYDMSPSPGDYFLATVGCEGRLTVFSHTEKSMVLSKQFKEDGVSLLWLPFKVDPSGSTIVIGFRTGILRVIVAMVKFSNERTEQVNVVQTIKPHSSAITVLIINGAGSLLMSGSEDHSIFIYSFIKGEQKVEVVPLGMIKMPGAVTDISYNQHKPSLNMFLVSCDNGQVAEIIFDETNREMIRKASSNTETYVLDISPTITNAVVRGKGSKSREYFSRYVGNNLIWIEEKTSTHSYHNYLYKVGGPLVAKLDISGGQTVQCTIELHGGKYMALGLNNGVIKVIKKNDESCNFSDSWQIVMHNTRNYTIRKLSLSYDHKILYSCGNDSGIFAYKVNLEGDRVIDQKVLPFLSELPKIDKKCAVSNLSLEEERIKKKTEKKRLKHKREVEKFKEKVIVFLTTYYRMVEINKSLPKCLRIPKSFFRLQTRDERELEKRKILKKEEEILAPLKERQKKLFEKVHTIKKHFIDPIKTQKFYLFAIRKPNYLKSFPERRLFSKDPLGEVVDPDVAEREERWESLLTGEEKKPQGPTEFERMINKIVTKLGKEREMEMYYDHCRDGSRLEGHGVDSQGEDVPDLITAAGSFLTEHGKFTQAEKTTFNRINMNRLKRLKCVKEMERVEKLKTGFQSYYDRVDALFNNLIKSESKGKEKIPPVTERLHHLLNIRQLIYLHKETFNKALRELRKEKTALINYYYWAQEEYKYIITDLKHYGLDLEGVELPKPLEVVWDLEYPDHLKFKPGPMPSDINLRMEIYQQNSEMIERLMPINELKKQVRKDGIHNHRLFQLVKYRKECFWSSVITIRETLDNMITEFDEKFMPLILQRSKASVDINYLKAEYSSTLQEVDILYRYEILQNSASCYKFETIKMKHTYILRENIRKKKVSRFNEQMKECHRTIDDLNAKFMELIKDDKWGKHLTRTYKKKYKPPRKSGSSTVTELSSESSSDDDDDDDYDDGDDDSDADQDEHGEPGAGVGYIYDETILPPGCDEEKFRYTFKLRGQRHVEENRIAEIKKEKEIIVEEVKSIKQVIKICDVLLALFYSGTFRFLKMMRDEMDDIDYLITLHPSQIQIFDKKDPYSNVPPLEECRLIEQEEYILKTKILRQLKEAIDGVKGVVEKTQKCTKLQVKELRKLAERNSKRYHEIQELLTSKFGEHIDVDAGQTYVLMSMIKRAIRRTANELMEKEKQEKKEAEKTDKLKYKEELIKMKRDRMRTLQTLYTIEAENNRIMADKLAHEKHKASGKIDLTKERDSLVKKLAEVEDEEKRLKTAIKEV